MPSASPPKSSPPLESAYSLIRAHRRGWLSVWLDAESCTAPRMITRWDISFANIYLLDERAKRAILAETVGLEKGTLLCPQLVTLYRMKQSYANDSSLRLGA